ncbi:MAG: L,D-transpeptidase [Chthoniobacterales bacterium]|nr:L,D-transpeptidase [Chthoniobacterales bacterium]
MEKLSPRRREANKKAQPPSPRALVVNVGTQTLRVIEGRKTVATFSVSTSKFGLGNKEGSLKTPTGRFRIARKIGGTAPLWTIFRARKNTGRRAKPGGKDDLVLTRILTLDGLEKSNANSLARYIYIHGTNQEHLIGRPASHGCVRLRNLDMAKLYRLVRKGSLVRIVPPVSRPR